MKRFLNLFSYLFHPIVIPLLACFLFFFITKGFYYTHEILIILSQVAIMTLLIPISIFYLLKSLNLLKSSIFLNKANERIITIIIFIILLSSLKNYVLNKSLTYEYKIYIQGAIYTYFLLLISIYFRKKYSVYVAGLAGCITFFILLSIKYYTPNIAILILLILILGLTASSRIYLKAHTSSEIIYGFILGVIPQIIFWQISYYNI